MKRGLLIGRFQPFHIGHLNAIEAMSLDLDEVIIGIGSSQYYHCTYNPFTAEERKKMIKNSLDLIKKPYHIIPIPDIHNYPQYVDHVISLAPKFDVVYCGKDEITGKLFKEKGYNVKELDRRMVSATEIRNMMIKGNSYWKDLVPNGTLEVLLKINGEERVKDLSKKFPKYNFTVDIIAKHKDGTILVKRKHDPYKDYWALPGGFVEIKENGKQAAKRELFEETGIIVEEKDLKLKAEYSDPGRDPRGPSINLVYEVNATGKIKPGDDACDAKAFKKRPKKMAFDHPKMWDEHIK